VNLSRRAVLSSALATVATGALGFGTTRWVARRRFQALAHQLATDAIVRDLGVEYLTHNRGEASQSQLLTLLAGLGDLGLWAADGAVRGHAELQARIQSDFASGDTVQMGGWGLSRSMLRLSALAEIEWSRYTGVAGVFAPVALPEGVVYWTAPSASFRVPFEGAAVEFRLRTGAPMPQRVLVQLDGHAVDEVLVDGPAWHDVRFLRPPSATSSGHLELTTAPEWSPVGDFRTVGIGIDRAWST
jgi:hypothetical protein